eukprot:84734_1
MSKSTIQQKYKEKHQGYKQKMDTMQTKLNELRNTNTKKPHVYVFKLNDETQKLSNEQNVTEMKYKNQKLQLLSAREEHQLKNLRKIKQNEWKRKEQEWLQKQKQLEHVEHKLKEEREKFHRERKNELSRRSNEDGVLKRITDKCKQKIRVLQKQINRMTVEIVHKDKKIKVLQKLNQALTEEKTKLKRIELQLEIEKK